MKRAGLVRGLLALTAALALHAPVPAQTNAFAQRPVTSIVPFPPGGPSDALARGFALHMGRQLGQTVVSENVAGADALQPAAVSALIARGLRDDVPALKAKGEYLD